VGAHCICTLKRKGKERKGKERKGKERKGKERKGKEEYLHRESKKGATLTMAITLSILDRFPKFFHYCREQ